AKDTMQDGKKAAVPAPSPTPRVADHEHRSLTVPSLPPRKAHKTTPSLASSTTASVNDPQLNKKVELSTAPSLTGPSSASAAALDATDTMQDGKKAAVPAPSPTPRVADHEHRSLMVPSLPPRKAHMMTPSLASSTTASVNDPQLNKTVELTTAPSFTGPSSASAAALDAKDTMQDGKKTAVPAPSPTPGVADHEHRSLTGGP